MSEEKRCRESCLEDGLGIGNAVKTALGLWFGEAAWKVAWVGMEPPSSSRHRTGVNAAESVETNIVQRS